MFPPKYGRMKEDKLMKNERNSSFELLRLLCIFGIIVMHTFAGVDTASSPANMAMNVFANSLFNTGVTCFILISGYFGIKFQLQKLIRLDLMIIFFTLLGTAAIGDFGLKDLVKSCIPVLSRQYWFITCYFALCILAPFLNRIAEKLSKESFRKLLLLLLLLFSIIPTFGFYDIMQDAGKGLADFIMIYLLGRYLSLYHNRAHRISRLACGVILSTLCIFAADIVLTRKNGVIYSTFSRDCSIFIIFSAVMLLLLFREFHFKSSLINRAAGNVLAVYVLDRVIHIFLNRSIDLNAYASEWYLMIVIFGYTLAVMLIGFLLNEIRKFTIGRIEPFLCPLIASILIKAGDLLTYIMDRLFTLFIKPTDSK